MPATIPPARKPASVDPTKVRAALAHAFMLVLLTFLLLNTNRLFTFIDDETNMLGPDAQPTSLFLGSLDGIIRGNEHPPLYDFLLPDGSARPAARWTGCGSIDCVFAIELLCLTSRKIARWKQQPPLLASISSLTAFTSANLPADIVRPSADLRAHRASRTVCLAREAPADGSAANPASVSAFSGWP